MPPQNVTPTVHPVTLRTDERLAAGDPAQRVAAVLPLTRPPDDPLAAMRARRAGERVTARAAVERGPELARLRAHGAPLKQLADDYGRARSTLAARQDLSDVGKAEVADRLHREFADALEQLARRYAVDEQALLDTFAGAGTATLTAARKAEDVARLTALAAVVPQWPMTRVLEFVRRAAADTDRVLLAHLWPLAEGLVGETDAHARMDVEALRPDVELALGDPGSDARAIAQERAAELRGQFHALAMTVARAGRWDAVYEAQYTAFTTPAEPEASPDSSSASAAAAGLPPSPPPRGGRPPRGVRHVGPRSA